MNESFRIGQWVFDASLGTLANDDDEIRLENRASRLLLLFCHSSGSLLSHEEIIEKVWDGRTTSPNSVAVVVADLRRALGDPARAPVFIETVPKRGYRLLVSPETISAPAARPVEASRRHLISRPRILALLGIGLVLTAVVAAQYQTDIANQPINIAVLPTENRTDSTEYDALHAAISELITVELKRHSQVSLTTDTSVPLSMSANLIIWNGHPAVSLKAINLEGETVWAGMASGPENKLPGQIRREIREFVRNHSQDG